MERCHCGLPVHYSNAATEAYVRRLIRDLGPFVEVQVANRTWLVQRHYLALHGIKGWELPNLGFTEITGEVQC